MPTSTLRRALSVAALSTAALAGLAFADGPTTAPAAVAKPDAAAVRASLQADLQAFQSSFQPTMLTDAKARDAAAAQVVPAARKVYADFSDMAAANPRAKRSAEGAQAQFNAILSLFGDADATGRLAAMADGKDAAASLDGKSQQLLVRWWKTAGDADAQAKVADDAEALAKAHPESEALTAQLSTMGEIGAATPALKDRVTGLIVSTMKNPVAEQVQAQAAGAEKLKALANHPLTIAGKTVDGKDFTTADWKGKVILVDFWATWCPPCRAELPRVEKIYADFHDKGLEILGVSNDRTAADLTKFVAADGKMPWTQLFDPAAAPQWNPITTGFGIDGIPTMFLIDRKGVCRTVEARETMETDIPKLLDEK